MFKETRRMAEPPNILVVSDLHFGEELLPGASADRRNAVELAGEAFREFLRYHMVRRVGGRAWRLVIAGDLFDFMSVVVAASPEQPARSSDERRYGLWRGVSTGVERLARICDGQRGLLADLAKFAAAGHTIEIIVGNHDVELLAPEVVAELERQLRLAGADDRAMRRISVVPWFVYVPGVAWIEHGHVYDEGCSFEFNLSPTDPANGRLVYNVDYAAIRYLGATVPDLDPHGIEEWSFWGFLRYSWQTGFRSFWAIVSAYVRFTISLHAVRKLHRSMRLRDARRRAHRDRLAAVATAGGLSVDAASAIDRLARTPMTISWRRIGRMLMLDRWGIMTGAGLAMFLLFAFAPWLWLLIGTVVVVGIAFALQRWLGENLVASQLPMRAVPQHIRRHVDVPAVVFGHTHDPRWQPLDDGAVYVNSGTWLPATRPGLRRSFTHVLIQPRGASPPLVELRQWRDGASQPFDAVADLGAGVSNPGLAAAG
jgi:UDP-2,3-diacylglucosamine pyrophosphatase LpxH